jgi:hypothetical protein
MSYEVTFTEDLNWNLTGNGNVLFSDMENQSGDDLYPIVNGMIVKVAGPALEGKDWDYTAGSGTGDRWISGAGDGELLYGGAYLGPNFTGSSIAPADYTTVEFRLGNVLEGTVGPGEAYTVDTGHPNASKAAMYSTWGPGNFMGIVDVPFSAWDVSGDAPRQLDICFRDWDGNGRWDMHWANDDESVALWYNYTWILNTDYSAGESWDATDESEDYMGQNDIDGGPVLWALWLGPRGSRDFFGDDGTLTLIPNIVNSPVDVFSFTTESAATLSVTDDDLDMINIFPNPYYGFHRLEIVRSAKYATINHLPKKATIRIFNLGGNLVRTIEKDDVTQYAEWDLENQYGFPVASGVYVIHIDLPDAGKEKVLKFALVQEEQILLSY